MAGIGERMRGGMLVFDRDGRCVSYDGGPPPGDATLGRLKAQGDVWRSDDDGRPMPDPGLPARPLSWGDADAD